MASRCITTLNDLDKISNRIYHKHSKGRFRAGIEAKLKAARQKAERSLREIDDGSCAHSHKPTVSSTRTSVSASSTTLSSRYFASTTSRSTTSERQKREAKEKTSKPSTSSGQRDQSLIQRRKTKSCPSCAVANDNKKQSKHSSSDAAQVPRTASVFGKYNGKGSEYKPTAWFNLPVETSVGVIDSFACDAKKEKPLCFSINVKKGESVPNLLRHNLEVRVGQNGVVRTQKKSEAETSEVEDRDSRQGKKRTAPLSWEEQLHWQNACVISSEPQTDGNSSSKGLCETHPVVFHEKKSLQEKDAKRSEDKSHSPSYKLGLESRWVCADRRNLVFCGDKCITSVEIEDTRSGDDAVVCKERKQKTEDCANAGDKQRKLTVNTEDRIPKKVSFEDEEVVKTKTDSIETEKNARKSEVEKAEVVAVAPKTFDTEKVVIGDVRKIRAKTSCERSRTHHEELTKEVRKLRRPHTAPPAPPSSPRGYKDFRVHNFFAIKIPTSRGEEESNNFLDLESDGEKQNIIEFSESSTPEDDKLSDSSEEFSTFSVDISPVSSPEKGAIQDGGPPKKCVTFGGCKSAPVSRTASRHEKVSLPRAKSSTAVQRSPCKPKPPIVVESKSSLELPKDLPPAQALVALRKQIRDDLAQQNRELQLDIQQLYLRKHSD